MADFKTPNLCGANPELNNALSKIDDLIGNIDSKISSAASEAAAAFETGLADVKAGLDGLAIDLPEVPAINFQSEITSLINDIDRTTIQGIAAFSTKLAQLELDFGDTLKEKGLTLDSLITDATSKISGGGNICDLVPNIELPADGVVKEKPVEAKQADTSPEPEEVSIVTTNVLSVENKTTFKFSSLIKKLDNLSGGQIDTTKVNSDISSALSAIKSPEFKAKMQADLDYAAAERKKLFADPLNYKKVVVPSGSVGEPAKTVEVATPEVQNTVKVETVTKTNPVTKQEETVTVKKTEKSTISLNGIAMRKVVLKERFHTKDSPEKFSKMKGSTLVDDMSKLTLKKFPIRVLSVRGRPYYGENRESRGFKFYAYDNPSEYGGDDYGVKTFRKPSTLIELSQQTYDDGEKQANPANMTVMLVKYFVYEKLDPNFKG